MLSLLLLLLINERYIYTNDKLMGPSSGLDLLKRVSLIYHFRLFLVNGQQIEIYLQCISQG